MKKIRFSALMMAFSACSSSAWATFLDGNKLYDMCSRNRPAVAFYLAGVSDTIASSPPGQKQEFCTPRQATGEQVTDVICNYLRDYPDQRHYTAASTAVVAFRIAFPCQ